MYGPVRTVVWQGSVGDHRPYADLVTLKIMRDRTLKGCEASRMPSTHISLNYHIVLCTKGLAPLPWCVKNPKRRPGVELVLLA